MVVGKRSGADWGGLGIVPETGSSDEPTGAEVTLDRMIQSRIGDQLRAMYDGLMEQPVPDRFHALIARLGDGGGLEGSG